MNNFSFEVDSNTYSIFQSDAGQLCVLINTFTKKLCKVYLNYENFDSMQSTIAQTISKKNLSIITTDSEVIFSELAGIILFQEFHKIKCSVSWDSDGYLGFMNFDNGESQLFEVIVSNIPHSHPYELRQQIQELVSLDEFDMILAQGQLILTTKPAGRKISMLELIEYELSMPKSKEVQEEHKTGSNNMSRTRISLDKFQEKPGSGSSKEEHALIYKNILAAMIAEYKINLANTEEHLLHRLNNEGGSLSMKIKKPSMRLSRAGNLKNIKEVEDEPVLLRVLEPSPRRLASPPALECLEGDHPSDGLHLLTPIPWRAEQGDPGWD